MKRRWYVYVIIAILFGIFDFFYQQINYGAISSYFVRTILTWGIWLLPIIPIAIYESRISKSIAKSAMACMATWSISIITYYFISVIKLVLIGQASRPEMYIANYKDEFYWINIRSYLIGDFLGSIIEWIGIAIIGGGIIGLLVSFIYLRLRKTLE